ncbi:ead/Ea22-like family protein [Citrobacter freundii]|uniref:ead/Ea22-like family protein n=1 Tax=Citrobacter freundii TaxID=546 RepID=UPI00374F98F7
MTALNKQALREAAQEEIMLRSVSDTSDAWQDEASPEAVLALLDELEAAEKRIAELEARNKPKFVKCWSCKHDIEVLAIVDCDGYCPSCAAPIDLDDEPYAGIGVKGE